MTLSKRSILFFVLALNAGPLRAAPPPMPEFVLAHVNAANLGYELPRAQFEPYVREYFEKASVLYYWDEGSFSELVTSD